MSEIRAAIFAKEDLAPAARRLASLASRVCWIDQRRVPVVQEPHLGEAAARELRKVPLVMVVAGPWQQRQHASILVTKQIPLTETSVLQRSGQSGARSQREPK